jgi:hypothetical protein
MVVTVIIQKVEVHPLYILPQILYDYATLLNSISIC